MKKILFLSLSLTIPLLILISIIRFYTVEKGDNDCMIDYNKKTGYIYEIEPGKYHIDNKQLSYLKQIGTAKGCYMQGELRYSYMFLTNSIYCGVSSVLQKS